MFSIAFECDSRSKDERVADLWEFGTSGIQEEDLPGERVRLRAFFDQQSDAEAAAARFGGSSRAEEQRDWEQVMRDGWQPLLAGERFFLAPTWRDDPTPPGRLRLVIDPGLACGTGTHATTQLCLETMERLSRPGDDVLDLGTGSGILAIAASLLGAGRVIACDIDHSAVTAALRNARIADARIALFTGSARAIRPRTFDLLLVNINAATIANLSAEVAGLRKTGGKAVLTGFPKRDAGSLQQTLEKRGLRACEILEKGEWAALIV